MTEDNKFESIEEFVEHIITLPNSTLMREAFNNRTSEECKSALLQVFKVTNMNDPMFDILTELRYPGII